MKKKALGVAFRDTLPVMTGYLFLGIGFGVLLHETGYGTLWSLAMGLFIYAGSAQYLTVSLLASGASLISTAISVLLLNARHLFYGLSMLERYKNTGKKKPYLIFSLTDETYSLVAQKEPPEGVGRHSYYFWVSILDHSYWVAGCTLGGLLGAALPFSLKGIDFVLTALFVMIFVEQWLSSRDHVPALIGAGSTAVCLLIFGKELFLIPSLILISILLTLTRGKGKEADR